MSGWRGSGGSGCRPLLREIWQPKPGERKGRELEGVAESGRGFLHRETRREIGWKGRGAHGHQSSMCLLTCLVPSAEGLGTEGTHNSPRKGSAHRSGDAGGNGGSPKSWVGGRVRKTVEGRGKTVEGRGRNLASPRGRGLGPREGLRETFSWERKGEARGEAWDRQGPRGRFTR